MVIDMRLCNRIYYLLNKRAVEDGMKYMKKLSVKKLAALYMGSLTKKHDGFNILKENSEYVDILSWKGSTRRYLFRYHKCQIVFQDQYEEFITLAEKNRVNRAFYITCGTFEEKIYNYHRMGGIMRGYWVELIDCFELVKKSLGLRRKWISIKCKNDIFDLYSP